MKYVVSYSRKVKAGLPYEMLEIGLTLEADLADKTMEKAFNEARDLVNFWIIEEQKRLGGS